MGDFAVGRYLLPELIVLPLQLIDRDFHLVQGLARRCILRLGSLQEGVFLLHLLDAVVALGDHLLVDAVRP